MKSILIISMNCRASHVSHLKASYRQAQDLGLEPILYLNPEFLNYGFEGFTVVTSDNRAPVTDYAIVWFPALGNLRVMSRLRMKGTKLIYVLHEPWEGYRTYLKSGNSHLWTIQFLMKYQITLMFLMLAHKIVLPSQKAFRLYENGLTRYANRNVEYLPLIYEDEKLSSPVDRQYFSYIGTISADHAFDNYVKSIDEMAKDPRFDNLKFLIATRYKVEKSEEVKRLIASGRLKIQEGRPLTDDEINTAYASSFLVWNAYHRTTQSGVLAKSFMFGTPGLVCRRNLSEFVQENKQVVAVDTNDDYDAIKNAVDYSLKNFENLSVNARQTFENTYHYKVSNHRMKEILQSL